MLILYTEFCLAVTILKVIYPTIVSSFINQINQIHKALTFRWGFPPKQTHQKYAARSFSCNVHRIVCFPWYVIHRIYECKAHNIYMFSKCLGLWNVGCSDDKTNVDTQIKWSLGHQNTNPLTMHIHPSRTIRSHRCLNWWSKKLAHWL